MKWPSIMQAMRCNDAAQRTARETFVSKMHACKRGGGAVQRRGCARRREKRCERAAGTRPRKARHCARLEAHLWCCRQLTYARCHKHRPHTALQTLRAARVVRRAKHARPVRAEHTRLATRKHTRRTVKHL
jgi:hypothetical protein